MNRFFTGRALPGKALGSMLALGLVVYGTVPASWSVPKPGVNAEAPNVFAAESEHPSRESLIEPSVAAAQSPIGRIDIGDGSVVVPEDLDDGVSMRSPGGEQIHIALPNTDTADVARVAAEGIVTYDGLHSSNSVIAGDNGVQMLTALEDALAPTRYDYRVTLGEGDRLVSTSDGASILGPNGQTRIALSVPWATDATGKAVPTHYEVNGDVLTQVVDHRSVSDVAYPVVADPIWLAPWVVKCLVGLGLNSAQITKIGSLGSPGSLGAAFGRAVVACVFGK
jgi:hypothetical protein